MQCCEFDILVEYMKLRLTELDLDHHYHRLELADFLMDHGVTTIDHLADVASPAREFHVRSKVAA